MNAFFEQAFASLMIAGIVAVTALLTHDALKPGAWMLATGVMLISGYVTSSMLFGWVFTAVLWSMFVTVVLLMKGGEDGGGDR